MARSRARPLRALATANARYWPTVAAHVQRELRSWQAPTEAIPDPELRALALEKLQHERFNAEVAATLATLAPRPHRPAVTQAIVALELLFDYLDGRTEQLTVEPLQQTQRLYEPFIAAVVAEENARIGSAEHDAPADWGYLTQLSARTRSIFAQLPAAANVQQAAAGSAARCAQGQARLHTAANTREDGRLEAWARENSTGSGLAWREYLAGCASSVLAVHALIAAGAEEDTSVQDARAIDAAYLAIAAVITILDSVVDQPADQARGQAGFITLYEPGELPGRMRTLTREALARAYEAPHGEHHAMTLAGVAAYYTTHPGARQPEARPVVQAVRRELTPTIWPALAVLRGWRAAKHTRALTRRSRRAVGINSSHGDKP